MTLLASNRPAVDPRQAAFCHPTGEDVFHSVVNLSEVWTADRFDVPEIHAEARQGFDALIGRATRLPPPAYGKVLLLLGEGGSGKTHLMRAFRTSLHSHHEGYFGYMQMTTAIGNYAGYMLVNLLQSLEQPYLGTPGSISSLTRLAAGLLDAVPGTTPDERRAFRNGEAADEENRVVEYADRLAGLDRFAGCDLTLMRALLHLQRGDPRVRNRVLMWLRCEDMMPADRVLLGGIVPRTGPDAAMQTLIHLGRLIHAVHQVPLVVCIDQLENVAHQDDAENQFRRMVDDAIRFTGSVPTAVMVIACLEDYYTKFGPTLSPPQRDRLEKDPVPVRLKGQRSLLEIEQLVARRLQGLFEECGAPFNSAEPLSPFTSAHLKPLERLTTRQVLEFFHQHHQRCILVKQWVEPNGGEPPMDERTHPSLLVTQTLEQRWNDFRVAHPAAVPDAEDDLARLLAFAAGACAPELPDGNHFGQPEANGRMIEIEGHHGNTIRKRLIAVCQKTAQGGGLGKQVAEVENRAGDIPAVLVRTTPFPATSKSEISQRLGRLIGKGWRKVVAENADWRTIQAFRAFRDQHGQEPEFAAWQQEAKPLASLPSLRDILALNTLTAHAPLPPAVPTPTPIAPPEPVVPPPSKTDSGPLQLGTTRSARPSPVVIEPHDLTRHMAFLGSSGSGKTTAALVLVEQLLLRGIPAVFIDRKGDLCRYADPDAWTRPLPEAEAARRAELRARLDIAVYTPGRADGRALALPVVPPGLAELPEADRDLVAGQAAAALASMMGFKTSATDQQKLAILTKAIEVLAEVEAEITVPTLRDLVESRDPDLLNAVGGFDDRVYRALADGLRTLHLNHHRLMSAEAEPVDFDALLGRGSHARPDRTRLSVVSTKFLGDDTKVDFWLARFLMALFRWGSKNTTGTLQLVLLLDEADKYLPANSKPATKEPTATLLRRGRSAGLGVMLATQSPGDLDYRCREQVNTWLIGRVSQATAQEKLRPVVEHSPLDVLGQLAGQTAGEFFLANDRDVTPIRARQSFIKTEQVPDDRILELARATRTDASR